MIYYSFIKDYSGFAVFLLCIVLKMFISPGFGLLVEKKKQYKDVSCFDFSWDTLLSMWPVTMAT